MDVRIFEVDGEAAVEIPSEILDALSLKVGDTIDARLEQRDTGSILICQPTYCHGERTVVKDGYGGAYSGAAFIAWPLPQAAIPRESQGGASEAERYWSEPRLAGKGETPEEALLDLDRQCRAHGFPK